ncbi:MAG: molecular chaperone DnaJ [Candidatus Micrarchaeota archaeon]
MKKDYYDVLGVNNNASLDEIKKAYRALAMKHHPDRNNEKNSEEKFKEVSEAYAILSNTEKRKQYDSYGHSAFQGVNYEDVFRQADFSSFEDLFENMGFTGFGGGVFNDFFSSSNSRENLNTQDAVEITLEEAFHGTTKTIKLEREVECSHCNGTGAHEGKTSKCSECNGTGHSARTQRTPFGLFQTVTTCSKCRGAGESFEKKCSHCHYGSTTKKEELEIEVPKGIDNNSLLRVRGKGTQKHGRNGDLYLQVVITPNASFKRQGRNLFVNAFISFPTAVLGSKIKIKTIDGKEEELSIPNGTESGSQAILEGKGMPSTHGRGDLIVNLIIDVPKKLNKKQKEAIEKLSKELGEKPRKKIFGVI